MIRPIAFALAAAFASCATARAQTPALQVLLTQLRSDSPAVRGAARELLRETAAVHADEYRLIEPLIQSPDTAARLAGTEILGVMGVANRDVTPLLMTELRDPIRSVRVAALGSLLMMKRNAAAAVPELMRLVDGTDQDLRWFALDVIDETQSVGSFVPRLVRLLQDSVSAVRQSTAYALGGTPPSQRAGVARALFPLLHDADGDVRFGVLATLGRIGASDSTRVITALQQFASTQTDNAFREAAMNAVAEIRTGVQAPGISCIHRTSASAQPMSLEVLQPRGSLIADGTDRYPDHDRGARVNSAVAFNLTLAPDAQARSLSVGLGHPVDPRNEPLGLMKVSEYHVFYLFDANRVIWNFREMPVGTTVASPRSEFVLTRDGRTYRLQFGSWGVGDCDEPYAKGGRINGFGTTPVQLTRMSDSLFRASVPPDGVGRLWDWTDPAHPINRGLYNISFGLLMQLESAPKR